MHIETKNCHGNDVRALSNESIGNTNYVCIPLQTDKHSAKLDSDMEQAKRTYTQEKLDREERLVANRKRQVHFSLLLFSTCLYLVILPVFFAEFSKS